MTGRRTAGFDVRGRLRLFTTSQPERIRNEVRQPITC
jgi:hypothetical protein